VNAYQELWWEQASSDYEVLVLLRRNGVAHCHQLHYLQMVTEKLAKAYFWRTGNAPTKRHSGFAQFMRFLIDARSSDQAQLASLLGFKSFNELQGCIRGILPIIYGLEQLAPTLSQDGPNPEYPWPHAAPSDNPVGHQFEIWSRIDSPKGRQLMKVLELAIEQFPSYG
jgi:hypothetical protein